MCARATFRDIYNDSIAWLLCSGIRVYFPANLQHLHTSGIFKRGNPRGGLPLEKQEFHCWARTPAMFPRDVEDRNDEVPFNPPRFEFNIGPLKSSFAVNLICWTFQLFNKWPIFFIISSKFEEKKRSKLMHLKHFWDCFIYWRSVHKKHSVYNFDYCINNFLII